MRCSVPRPAGHEEEVKRRGSREEVEGVFMSDLTFVQIDGQHVELLPARTVLSMFAIGQGGQGDPPPGSRPAHHNV
jgi:hypothetical protein